MTDRQEVADLQAAGQVGEEKKGLPVGEGLWTTDQEAAGRPPTGQGTAEHWMTFLPGAVRLMTIPLRVWRQDGWKRDQEAAEVWATDPLGPEDQPTIRRGAEGRLAFILQEAVGP